MTAPTAQEWAEERARELHCNHAVGVERHQAENCIGCRLIAAALVEKREAIERVAVFIKGKLDYEWTDEIVADIRAMKEEP